MHKKVAIVTGVSRLKGIGRAICLALAKKGIDIFFTYWTPYDNEMPWKVKATEPETIQAEIRALGVRCEKLELDLAQSTSIEQLFEQVNQTLGSPSILVNNATYSTQTTVEDITGEELDKHYAVNLRATTLLCVEFVRRFKEGLQGRIINMSSGQSLGPMSDEIAYAITKGAIETLTYTLHQKIAARGITINAVNPGPTDTGWMDAEVSQVLVQQFPSQRIGMPKDVAKLIAFLASEEAAWITGQVIHSEGGFIR